MPSLKPSVHALFFVMPEEESRACLSSCQRVPARDRQGREWASGEKPRGRGQGVRGKGKRDFLSPFKPSPPPSPPSERRCR